MTGQLTPDQGRVMLDGVDLSTVDPASLSRHVGYLSDQGELVRGTLLENLTLFDRERETAAMKVADELGLNDVAAYLSQGFEAKLGGRIADILPRGVVQRIAIARVLAMEPRVILVRTTPPPCWTAPPRACSWTPSAVARGTVRW